MTDPMREALEALIAFRNDPASASIPLAAIDVAIKALTATAPGWDELEPVLSFLDELAANAASGKRESLNPILIGGSAKLYAEGLREALRREAPASSRVAQPTTIDSGGRAVTSPRSTEDQNERQLSSHL